MSLNTKLARKILTKKEQKHLTESGINSTKAMIEQITSMEGKSHYSVCAECRQIGKKLNLIQD